MRTCSPRASGRGLLLRCCLAILGRLKDREQASLLAKAGFRSAEAAAVLEFEEEAMEAQKELLGRKMNAPIDAYRFLEKLPLEQMAYLLAESSKSAALSKIRAYLNKWRPIRLGVPAVVAELEALGMARGPKFDQVVEQVFAMQLTGRGKTKEEREKILRKLSGIKEQPKKKEKEKKPAKGTDKAHAAAAMGDAAKHKHAAAKADAKACGKRKACASQVRWEARGCAPEGCRVWQEERRPQVIGTLGGEPSPVGNVRMRNAILLREF